MSANFPPSFAVCMLPLSRRYVAELQALKAVLLAAAAEQEALEKRVAEVSGVKAGGRKDGMAGDSGEGKLACAARSARNAGGRGERKLPLIAAPCHLEVLPPSCPVHRCLHLLPLSCSTTAQLTQKRV